MRDFKLNTPVAFIIFNRPDTTDRVFAEIAKAKPTKLLVVSDGPRISHPDEAALVAATRAIIERVDWPCKVLTNYSDVNLGCKKRVSSGISWVFEQVDEAIILEDDCLPDPSFFRFCEEMLERYRHDQRIGMISGDNFQFSRKRTEASYYFSRYNHIWGWATWKRAWSHYHPDATIWPAFRDGGWLESIIRAPRERKYWSNIFQAIYEGRIDTWDYQWLLTSWSQGMVSVMPNINLISNIGFGPNATHTHGASIYANMNTESIEFPLRHPEFVLPNQAADTYTANGMFNASILRRLSQRLRAIIGRGQHG